MSSFGLFVGFLIFGVRLVEEEVWVGFGFKSLRWRERDGVRVVRVLLFLRSGSCFMCCIDRIIS